MNLFLCMVWGYVITWLIYTQLSCFPNTTCWRDYLFSMSYSCLLCGGLTDCNCVGLFIVWSLGGLCLSLFFFFCLFVFWSDKWLRLIIICWKKWWEWGTCLSCPDFSRRAFSFSPLSVPLAVVLSWAAFIMLRYVPCIPT